MKFFASLLASATLLSLTAAHPAPAVPFSSLSHAEKRASPLTPKVFIISMFKPEAEIWHGIPEFDLLAQNISTPGLSPLFEQIHCTADGEICQIVTGESEINAAATISAMVLSPYFDLTKTYFFIAGIAGVNPELGTTGSVTFARYAVQVALQYEIDIRELPSNFTTGYFPQGSEFPDEYPQR